MSISLNTDSIKTTKKGKKKKTKKGLSMVIPICSPSYLGGKDQEDHSSRPTQAKSETPSRQKSQAQWYMTIIPATQ
jgi:hypothetical protein